MTATTTDGSDGLGSGRTAGRDNLLFSLKRLFVCGASRSFDDPARSSKQAGTQKRSVSKGASTGGRRLRKRATNAGESLASVANGTCAGTAVGLSAGQLPDLPPADDLSVTCIETCQSGPHSKPNDLATTTLTFNLPPVSISSLRLSPSHFDPDGGTGSPSSVAAPMSIPVCHSSYAYPIAPPSGMATAAHGASAASGTYIDLPSPFLQPSGSPALLSPLVVGRPARASATAPSQHSLTMSASAAAVEGLPTPSDAADAAGAAKDAVQAQRRAASAQVALVDVRASSHSLGGGRESADLRASTTSIPEAPGSSLGLDPSGFHHPLLARRASGYQQHSVPKPPAPSPLLQPHQGNGPGPPSGGVASSQPPPHARHVRSLRSLPSGVESALLAAANGAVHGQGYPHADSACLRAPASSPENVAIGLSGSGTGRPASQASVSASHPVGGAAAALAGRGSASARPSGNELGFTPMAISLQGLYGYGNGNGMSLGLGLSDAGVPFSDLTADAASNSGRGAMHGLSTRISGVISSRPSSFVYGGGGPALVGTGVLYGGGGMGGGMQGLSPHAAPSPPRSSINLVQPRISMSGAGSMLSLPFETGSLCDVTAPATGLVAEQTAFELGMLAPALDLWAAGSQLSPQSKIAQGAYGVVYRGLWHGCTCAVKVMLAASAGNLSTQLTEVFLCKALSCHPNIVQTFDCNVWRITGETLLAAHMLVAGLGHGGASPAGAMSGSPYSAGPYGMGSATSAATSGADGQHVSSLRAPTPAWMSGSTHGGGGGIAGSMPSAPTLPSSSNDRVSSAADVSAPCMTRAATITSLTSSMRRGLSQSSAPEAPARTVSAVAESEGGAGAYLLAAAQAAMSSHSLVGPDPPEEFTQPVYGMPYPARGAPPPLQLARQRSFRDPYGVSAAPVSPSAVYAAAKAPVSAMQAAYLCPVSEEVQSSTAASEGASAANTGGLGTPVLAAAAAVTSADAAFAAGGLSGRQHHSHHHPHYHHAHSHPHLQQHPQQQHQQPTGWASRQGPLPQGPLIARRHTDTQSIGASFAAPLGSAELADQAPSQRLAGGGPPQQAAGAHRQGPDSVPVTPSHAAVGTGDHAILTTGSSLGGMAHGSAPPVIAAYGSSSGFRPLLAQAQASLTSNPHPHVQPPHSQAADFAGGAVATLSGGMGPSGGAAAAGVFVPQRASSAAPTSLDGRFGSPDPSTRGASTAAIPSFAHSRSYGRNAVLTPMAALALSYGPPSGSLSGIAISSPVSSGALPPALQPPMGVLNVLAGAAGAVGSPSCAPHSRMPSERTIGRGSGVLQQVRSATAAGDEGDAVAAEAGARNLAQVLRMLGAREGQLAVALVMEECDRGSLQALLSKAAATADTGVGSGGAGGGGGAGGLHGAARGERPSGGMLYAPFTMGGRYALSAALRALVLTAKEVALGMAFLHVNNIIHGDLKPGNVLLKSSRQDQRGFVAKISDFGLGRVLHSADARRGLMGPDPDGGLSDLASGNGEGEGAIECLAVGGSISGEAASDGVGGSLPAGAGLDGTVPYLAPELINNGQRSKASDVWAYGVLLWQLLTGRRPYEGLMHVQIMVAVSGGEQLLAWPEDAHPSLVALGRGCMAMSPRERPTFAQVVRRLQGLEAELRALPLPQSAPHPLAHAYGHAPGQAQAHAYGHPPVPSQYNAPRQA